MDGVSGRDPSWWDGIRPYLEKGPLAALALGISSGFPFLRALLTWPLSKVRLTGSYHF